MKFHFMIEMLISRGLTVMENMEVLKRNPFTFRIALNTNQFMTINNTFISRNGVENGLGGLI